MNILIGLDWIFIGGDYIDRQIEQEMYTLHVHIVYV